MGPTSEPIGRTKRRTKLQLRTSRPLPRENVVRPLLHKRTPSSEHIFATVRSGCDRRRLVRQRSFDCRRFFVEVVVSPIRKRGSKPMRHNGTTVRILELEATQDRPYIRRFKSARPLSADAVRKHQRTRRISLTSLRKNAQGLARQRHAMPYPLLHTAPGNDPELGLEINLRPPCLRSLTKANRCEHEEGDRQLEHLRHGRSVKRREQLPNLVVRQARLVLRQSLYCRKPVDDLLGRIVMAVFIADRPAHKVNQLMPHPMTDRATARPVRVNDVEAIVDRDLVHPLGTKRGKNIGVETTAVPNLRIRGRPALAQVLDDKVNSLSNSRCRRDGGRRRFTRITALASNQSDRVSETTRDRQRNERVRT